MGEKRRRSVSLDETNDDFLSDHPNASALINDLVDAYRTAGSSREAALNVRVAEAKADRHEAEKQKHRAEAKVQQYDQRLDQLHDQLTGLSDEEEQAVAEVVRLVTPDENGFRKLDPEQLAPDHDAVKIRANKVGLKPSRFLDEVRDRL